MWRQDVACPLCNSPVPIDPAAPWPFRYSTALVHLRSCSAAAAITDDERGAAALALASSAGAGRDDARLTGPAGSDGAAMPSILIVEDDPGVRSLLSTALSASYTCALAADGEEALDRLQRGNYDAVLLDLMLPRVSGLDVLARANHERQNFIVITAAGDDMQQRAIDLGAQQVIRKPFTIDQVLQALSTVRP